MAFLDTRSHLVRAFAFGLVLVALFARDAGAYVGPGAGLSAIGTVIALLAAIVMAVIGFVWYPVKRLLKRFRGNRAAMPIKPATE